MVTIQTNQATGGALVVGFLVVLLLLFRDPHAGLDLASSGVSALLYFAVLPLVGVAVGLYTYTAGSYHTVPLFLLASYLGVFGLALTLGSLLSPDPIGPALVVGLVLLPLAVLALVGSLLESTTSLGLDMIGLSSR
jgi:hypothetical protein